MTVVDLLRPVGSDLALDRADSTLDVGDGLSLGDLADEHLTVLGERDDGRGRTPALRVRDDRGLAALEDGDCRVGGTEVDPYRTCHFYVSCMTSCRRALLATVSLWV